MYNINLPSASAEVLGNMNILKQMGAISVETIMEKSDMIANKDVELKRLKKEEKVQENKEKKMMEQMSGDEGRPAAVEEKEEKKEKANK